MVGIRVIMSAALAVVLAGCVASTAGLSLNEAQALKIESVEVDAAPDAHIWWGKAEREYAAKVQAEPPATPKAKAKPKSDEPSDAAAEHAAIVESPEGKAYVRQRAVALLRERIEQDVKPAYQGTRRAKIIVTVRSMVVPSAVQRVLIGGSPIIVGDVRLVDLQTGTVIAKSPDPLIAGAPAGNGWLGVLVDQALSDLEDRLMDQFCARIKLWLPLPVGDTPPPKGER